MAVSHKAAETYAERTDDTYARVDGVIRAAQDSGLLPKARKGGGKGSVHLSAGNLVALAVGVAVAYPATTTGQIVPVYLGMRFYLRRIEDPIEQDGVAIGWATRDSRDRDQPVTGNRLLGTRFVSLIRFASDCLGETLEGLIADMERDPAVRDAVRDARLDIQLVRGRPSAAIRFIENGVRVTDFYVMEQQRALPGIPDITMHYTKPASTTHTATIPAPQLEMLADLLRDTLENQGSLLPTIDNPGGLPIPGNEDAARPRAASPDASLRSDPDERDHTRETSGLDNRKSTARVCVSSRGLDSEAGVSRPSNQRRRSHDQTHHRTTA